MAALVVWQNTLVFPQCAQLHHRCEETRQNHLKLCTVEWSCFQRLVIKRGMAHFLSVLDWGHKTVQSVHVSVKNNPPPLCHYGPLEIVWSIKRWECMVVYEELSPESDSALPARALEATQGAMEHGME